MRTTFEEGTELIVDSEEPALNYGYTDVNSAVERQGDLVMVALDFTAAARPAWVTKSKYALGAIVTEGGKTYRLIKVEEAAENEKPTTNPTFWAEVVNPLTLATLPPEYRPAAEATALKSMTATVKIGTDGTIKLSAAEGGQAHATYRAAVAAP
jgi:hypothetical protein